MSEATPLLARLSTGRILWWAIVAGFGFTLGGHIAGAPFEFALIWAKTMAGAA